MGRWRVAILAFLVFGCRTPRPEPPAFTDVPRGETDVVVQRDPRRVKVANYNVHLLFDPVCDSGRCASSDFESAPSPSVFEARAALIARQIEALDADVVCLEEVENQASLDAVTAHLPGFPTRVLGETGLPASVDVALVSRDRVREVVRHRDVMLQRPDGSSTVFAREFLQVTLDHEGREVVAFCAHFRSQRNDDPGRRLAEAEGARTIVLAAANAHPTALTVLAGDLNDVPGSAPMEALVANGGLVRAVNGTRPDGEASYVFNGQAQAIDHILTAPSAHVSLVDGTVAAHWDRYQREGYGGSDHAAISAVFAFAE